MGSCVACRSNLLEPQALFGMQLPSAIYNKTASDMAFLQESSLDLTMCSNESCRLVQLCTPVDLTYVYEHYPYQTGTTATMSSNLRDFAFSSLANVSLSPGDLILDIGGNDGTLLSFFADSSQELINIDAASGIKQCFQSPNYKYKSAYFSEASFRSITSKSPRVIFSSAMFYQLTDPGQFCQDINRIMSENTIFFMQMTYLNSMYKNNIFDNVVHEHVTYFSLFSLEHLLSLYGLRIIDASIIDLYGGTLRVAIVRKESQIPANDDNLKIVRDMETRDSTNSLSSLILFGENFQKWKKSAKMFIETHLHEYKSLIGFGASTKGNMLLQALELSSKEISVILDNNEKKIGTWTTKTLIPILSEATDMDIDRPVLVLPYYYLESLKKVIQNYIPNNKKIRIITLLPVPTSTEVKGTRPCD